MALLKICDIRWTKLEFPVQFTKKELCEKRGLQLVPYEKKTVGLRMCGKK
jgi:hypothetical protein